jgi:hypothetical protein
VRGPYIGHRLAHCCDHDLPQHLRRRDISLGYCLVDLTEVKMTEKMLANLFDEMDQTADELPATLSFWANAQIESWQLQNAITPI